MSDRDTTVGAWHLPPSAYIASRTPAFGIPNKPKSLYVTMLSGCRIALDYYLPQTEAGSTPQARMPTIVIFTPYYSRFVTTDPSIEVQKEIGMVTIVMTGGQKGIEPDAAKRICEAGGFDLVLTGRNPGELKEAAEALGSRYQTKVKTLTLDIASLDSALWCGAAEGARATGRDWPAAHWC